MAGRSARTKGASGELECLKIINEALGTNYCRTPRSGAWEHARADLFDPINELRLSVEIKRQETTKVDAWFKQAEEQCPDGDIPTLIYRRSRQPWKVVVTLDEWMSLQADRLQLERCRRDL